MKIGLLKEKNTGRVLLKPESTNKLTSKGFDVNFVVGIGNDIGYSDNSYEKNGCVKYFSNYDIVENSNLLICYKMPSIDILKKLKPKQILLCYSNPIINKDKLEIIAKRGATLLGIEFLKNKGKLDISEALSKMVSNVGLSMASYFINNSPLGSGKILCDVPLSRKLNVTIIGNGLLGNNISKGLYHKDCDINIYDININKIDNQNSKFNYGLISDSDFYKNIYKSDIVFSSVYNGKKIVDKIIKESDIKKMKKGSVIMDLSINSGGIIENSIATTMNDPCYLYNDVIICSPKDILEKSSKTFTEYFSSYINPYIYHIANGNLKSNIVKNSVLVYNGKINKVIQFLSDNVKDGNARDPFELMDNEISLNWKNDIINEKLDDINDYTYDY
jgi:alanine dehydrogenase